MARAALLVVRLSTLQQWTCQAALTAISRPLKLNTRLSRKEIADRGRRDRTQPGPPAPNRAPLLRNEGHDWSIRGSAGGRSGHFGEITTRRWRLQVGQPQSSFRLIAGCLWDGGHHVLHWTEIRLRLILGLLNTNLRPSGPALVFASDCENR